MDLEILNVSEVAEIVRLPESTVYLMARENRIGGVVRMGRRIRFIRADLEKWIAAGGEALEGGWRREPDERAA